MPCRSVAEWANTAAGAAAGGEESSAGATYIWGMCMGWGVPLFLALRLDWQKGGWLSGFCQRAWLAAACSLSLLPLLQFLTSMGISNR